MILSAIFHFLKMILGLAVKVIAWLLVSLSLWVPLLYTIVFVIACAFSGSSLSALKNWYFAGLALSFIGSFAISNYIYGRQLKNKKREKKPKSNIEKIKAAEPTPEIVKTEEQPQPQPELSPISEPVAAGRSIIQEAIAESEANPLGRERDENIARGEMRSKNETAVKHGFFSYDNPANNSAQSTPQNHAQNSGGEGKGFVGGVGAQQYTQDAGSQYKSGQDTLYRELGGDFGRRDSLFSGGFNEPPISGGVYHGGFQEGCGAGNNYNATGFSAGNSAQAGGSAANGYNPQNYQDGFSAGHNPNEQGFGAGNTQSGYNTDNYNPQANYQESYGVGNNIQTRYNAETYSPQNNYTTGNKFGPQDNPSVKFSEQNSDSGMTQPNSFNSGNNYSVKDSYSGYESYNAFDTPISGGFETRQAYQPDSQGYESRAQAYQPNSQGFESRSQGLGTPISGGGFEEQPKIFATRNDPTVFVYEYSDRLDYYKRTRSGMIFMHSRPKAANE